MARPPIEPRWGLVVAVCTGCGPPSIGSTTTSIEATGGLVASSTSSVDVGAATTDVDPTSGSSTGDATSCGEDILVDEDVDDAICLSPTTTTERLRACWCRHGAALLEPQPRPVLADDLLYYVNRWYSIDPCFPYPPPDAVLWSVRDRYINQVGDLEPELEDRCGAYAVDLVDVPYGQTDDADRLRGVAWHDDAPPAYPETLDALEVGFEGAVGFGPMFEAARFDAGIELYVVSGFRDLETQDQLFDHYATMEGDPALAAVYSAWPAHSEHQLGTTADVGYIENGMMISPFGIHEADLHRSPAFSWIRANAHRFGIVTTYSPDRVHVHQYQPEPWHLRFVGVEAADLMHACGLSTEELLAFRYARGMLPPYADMDLVYAAQAAGGWTEDNCGGTGGGLDPPRRQSFLQR